LKVHLNHFLKIKGQKKSQNSRNQGFAYFWLMIEGSGSGRPKNIPDPQQWKNIPRLLRGVMPCVDSVVDRQHLDADPDSDLTFCFDAESDLDPDPSLNELKIYKFNKSAVSILKLFLAFLLLIMKY
jgi:hypothetical protein